MSAQLFTEALHEVSRRLLDDGCLHVPRLLERLTNWKLTLSALGHLHLGFRV